jgi:ATP-binding cassette subfamily B protein
MKQEKKKIDFKYNLKEYFKIVSKHKLLFWGLIVSVILTEALFVVDKFLYKRIIDDAEKFITGSLTQTIFIKVILIIAAIFFGIVILRSIGSWVNGYLLAILEPKLNKDLKNKYFSHIINLSYKFHSNHKTGSLISRLGRGTSAIEGLTDVIAFQASPLILQFLMVFGAISAFTIMPAIVLAIIVVLFICYSIFIQNKQKNFRVLWNKSEDKESAFISDTFTNIDSIKFYGKEKRIEKIHAKLSEDTRIKNFKYYNYFSKLSLGQIFILGIGIIALLYFPIKEFLAGQITLGTIVFIYALYGNVSGNLFRFVWGIKNYYRAMADMQGLFEYGKVENEIKDKPNAKNLNIKEGGIEFRNISFKYEKKKLFENFNLKVKPNEKVALVGHSGCGKTTLIKLFNRFYDVDKGAILIDEENIRNFKQESLRGETGIVPQECILFDDTIYNNIKFSNPSATKKEVLNAIKFAQLDKTINNFPKKENTIVGERGVKLSGGEKQRVSIARAILANKKILVLDEATSALDSQTEHEIQKDLQKLLIGRTSIIIAHRLSTIMNADRIIVLEKGKIVEEGSHSELLKKNGKYKQLWNLQKGGYISD